MSSLSGYRPLSAHTKIRYASELLRSRYFSYKTNDLQLDNGAKMNHSKQRLFLGKLPYMLGLPRSACMDFRLSGCVFEN